MRTFTRIGQRIALASIVGIGSLSAAGALAGVSAGPAAALATCTDSLQGPTSGTTDWNASAANWSAGFPGSGSVACIAAVGTYTVVLTSGASINTLELGGTAGSFPTVAVDGTSGSENLTLGAPSAVENGATLTLEPTSVGNVGINGGSGSLVVGSGANLTTESASSNAYIQVPVTNQAGGTVTVGAASTQFNSNTATVNDGTLRVVSGGHLVLSNSSTLSNAATGRLGVVVNGVNGSISGPGTTLAAGSTLAVTTVGSPSVGTVFTPIGGPVTGTFTNLSFGPAAYAVAQPAGAVQLTTEAPLTLTASPLSARENVATGTVTLGTIGSASDGTGNYAATVDWGDRSGTGPATVTVSSSTGTVSGSHTYSTPGTYAVTSTLANADGTTLTTTESVVVTDPVVTGLSRVTVVAGKKLQTKISGPGSTRAPSSPHRTRGSP